MKRNSLTIIVGLLLLVIFALLLFTFQVRQTEVAVVTTFDKPTRFIKDDPGLKWKWPLPIQRVYKFDQRIQNFEEKFEETMTQDNFNLLIRVYFGWRIDKPDVFFRSFKAGSASAAQPALEGLIRSAKNAVVGKHPFAHFISTNEKENKFVEIEREMLEAVKPAALNNYGISIEFLGIKKLGLPESVTQKVFDRMTAERQREVERLRAQGEAEALNIQSAADRERSEILAKAEAEATAIRGQADAQAAQSYAVFSQNPELAVFLMKTEALKEAFKERAILVFDERMPPFDLFTRQYGLTTNKPASQLQQQPGAATNRNASSFK